MSRASKAVVPIVHTRVHDGHNGAPVVGRWYWCGEGGDRWLGCVVYLGSNYAEIKSVHGGATRVHFDEFEQVCTPEANATQVIAREVETHRQEAQRLMAEVQQLVARLHLTGTAALPAGDETEALVLGAGLGPIAEYKTALIRAKNKDLPTLFTAIEAANKSMATWMKAELIPLGGEVARLQRAMERIEDRIFNVELYAGLVESVACIREGVPASVDEPLHLLQRRHYMDEECLAAYETGGMDFRKIKDFDAWIAAPKNRDRILPFPRCVVAFQVRRKDKERPVDLRNFLQVLADQAADKQTFLYLRNGDRVYRLCTEVEFAESLFPDLDRQVVDRHELWANTNWGRCDSIITEAQHQHMLEWERAQAATWKTLTKAEREKRWMDEPSRRPAPGFERSDHYTRVTPDNIYYDDICKFINDEATKHNRVVLILQGLLDRSEVFHPHPPYKLWTGDGFAAAVRLIYDNTRVLTAGERPDFESYRARLNASLRVGCVTVGQEEAWERQEAVRENARRDRNYRRTMHDSAEVARYRPYGNPGPGRLAAVQHVAPRTKTCTYAWTRARAAEAWRTDVGAIPCRLVVPSSAVLNADAYTPGDFRQFFDDPRTRAEYLQWAPLLLEAEEYHAGNRELKPKKP